ncbi:hypothetical protein OF83DRAFT_1087131 [Amylostereum chailletii]|nr:hypothetical protein OF83DRAFT_1087131 [Amylostereum chailletii]
MVDWYYTLYALDAHAGTSPAKNTVASSVVEGPAAKITGPAIVVKNGPMDNWASVDTVISEVDLAQTLWWYYKSGVSVQEVFDVFLELCEHTTLPDLKCLAGSCRCLRPVRYFLGTLWLRSVAHFGLDPRELHLALLKTKSIIGDGVALKVTLHGTQLGGFQCDQLDIYCLIMAAGTMAALLEGHSGYKYLLAMSSKREDWWGTGCTAVIILGLHGTNKMINIHCSTTPTATSALPWSPTTLEMLFLSATQVCVLYPKHTFQGICYANPLRAWDDETGTRWMDHARNGFHMREFALCGVLAPAGWNPRQGPYYEVRRLRSVGDARCFAIDVFAHASVGDEVDGVGVRVEWALDGKRAGVQWYSDVEVNNVM